MQKPALLRAIYAELRDAVGPDVPAIHLLRLANILLLYALQGDDPGDYSSGGQGRAFHSLPVDEAMHDGGWRVLEFENRRGAHIDAIESDVLAALRPLIEKYLGPEWRYQQTPTDPL